MKIWSCESPNLYNVIFKVLDEFNGVGGFENSKPIEELLGAKLLTLTL